MLLQFRAQLTPEEVATLQFSILGLAVDLDHEPVLLDNDPDYDFHFAPLDNHRGPNGGRRFDRHRRTRSSAVQLEANLAGTQFRINLELLYSLISALSSIQVFLCLFAFHNSVNTSRRGASSP